MFIKGVIFAAALLFPTAAVAHPSLAAEKAEIIYSQDGRLVSVKADGSKLSYVTDTRHRKGSGYYDTDQDPDISPNGQRLVFSRYEEKAQKTERLMVSGRDGSNSEVVFAIKGMKRLPGRAWRYASIMSPTWSPRGQRVFFVLDIRTSSRNLYLTSVSKVLSVKPDGSDRRVHYVKRGNASSGSPPSNSGSINSVAVSSRGRHLLVQWWRDRGYKEMISTLDLKTGGFRFVHEGSDPSWSPNGSRIAFTSSFERLGRRNSGNHGEYSLDRRVYIARPDGSNLRRVVRGYGPGDEANPEWSPDGSRILFASDRNDRDAYTDGFEIYSIGIDGKCLAWITNGAPSSEDATWGPERGFDPSPAICGGQQLTPVVAPPTKLKGESGLFPETHYWLGSTYRGMNLSRGDHNGLVYEDCGRFNSKSCDTNWSVFTEWVCEYQDRDEFDYTGVATGLELRRGAVVMTKRGWGGSRQATILSGRQEIQISGGNRFKEKLEAIDDLRLIGQAEPEGDMPAAILDSRLVRLAERTSALFAETESIEETATELKLSTASVRSYLNIHRDLQTIGPVETAPCSEG